jgi:hypothetical protein
MKTTQFCLLCLILIIEGCAVPLSTIRQAEPHYTLTSEGPPKKIANCIAYESQKGIERSGCAWDSAKLTEIDGIYKILVTLTGGFLITNTGIVAEITVKPSQSGGSIIEYRPGNIIGPCKDSFWDNVVKPCVHQ